MRGGLYCGSITFAVKLKVQQWMNHSEVRLMKKDIHPEYFEAEVTCNCGNKFTTGSTKKEIHVEICSKCHPFYTGQQKAAQARGRIEAFNRKYGKKAEN